MHLLISLECSLMAFSSVARAASSVVDYILRLQCSY